MNKSPREFGILVAVCDDNALIREKYRRVLSEVPGVTVIPIEHPSLVETILSKTDPVSLLVMDLEFPVELTSQEMQPIGHLFLEEIKRNHPHLKVIIATKLGPSVYPIVIDSSRRRLHDDWIDSSRTGSDEELRARVESFLFPYGRSLHESGFWIMHVSDLHFGSGTRFDFTGEASKGALLDAFTTDLTDSFKKIEPQFQWPHLIISSGDSTHRGRNEEFNYATALFKGLQRSIGGSIRGIDSLGFNEKPSLIVIPGNHDINWDISRARCIFGDPLKFHQNLERENIPSELKYLDQYMWTPFEDFLNSAGASQPEFRKYWNRQNKFACARWKFPHAGVDIFALNTCANAVDHFGSSPEIDPLHLIELQAQRETDRAEEGRMVRFAVLHHPVGSVGSDDDKPNAQVLFALRQQIRRKVGAEVILSGHIHRDVVELITIEGGAVLSIGCGSSGASKLLGLGADLLYYNLIQVIPHSTATRRLAKIKVFPRLLLNGKFVALPDHERITFQWIDDKIGWQAER